MARKFWIVAVASLFIICLASVADAQRRAKPQRGFNGGNAQRQNPDNPGNGNQGENPGNGNQGEDPQGPGNGTPDGETPSEEVTCDDLKNGTPGLYGLCIAFCEAHDCVVTVTEAGELDFSQCKKNDHRLLDKYRSRMRDGDPDMPCLPATQANEDPVNSCPCWSLEQLDNFPYAQYGGTSIEDSWVDCDSFTDYDYGLSCDFGTNYVGETMLLSDGRVATVDFGAFGGGDCAETFCFGVFACNEEDQANCPDWLPVYDWYFDLSNEEYLNCQGQLQQLQARIGCMP